MATDNDFKYGLYVMNPDFTMVKLSSDENERKEMLEWIVRNCTGEYVIFAEHNHVCLKSERDRMWYELTFK